MADGQFQYVKLPDGSYGKFDAGASDDFIKSAIQKDFPNAFPADSVANRPAYNPKVPAPPDVNSSGLGAFLTRLGSKTTNLPAGLLTGFGPGQAASQLYSDAQKVANYVKTGQQPQQSILEATGSQLGVDTQAVKEDAQNRNLGGLAAETVFPVAQVLGFGKLAEKTGVMPEKQGISPAEGVQTVKNAVNPPANEVPKYQKTLGAQLDNIKQFAKDNNITISDRASMADVMTKAADSYKQKYYSLLDKADPYGTLKPMDARLTEINATLNPAYEKGGGANIASQAAVSAETKSALTAEAAGIRQKLFTEIAQRNGIPVEEVAAARNNMGALRYLAEKTNKALNVEQYAANKAAAKPVSVDTTATGLLTRGAEKVINKIRGNPSDRATSNVFRQR